MKDWEQEKIEVSVGDTCANNAHDAITHTAMTNDQTTIVIGQMKNGEDEWSLGTNVQMN